jgi:hypothetical protein
MLKIGICSIQRNRGKYLKEWVAFHNLVGFDVFYIYLHKCTDNSFEIISQLQKKFNIICHHVEDNINRPQLQAYTHAYTNYGHEVDWIAFIDGDEFLYPTKEFKIKKSLEKFNYKKTSAIGVYWQCFGSNGHIKDPDGLIIEDYLFMAKTDFPDNKHIKSIVRGRQGQHFSTTNNSHIFNTIYGTHDELNRPINKGLMYEYETSTEELVINHYVCQSYEFFKNFKQKSGAADAGSQYVRPEEWWKKHDANDIKDGKILKYLPKLKKIINDI